jgi:hypothetical protein
MAIVAGLLLYWSIGFCIAGGLHLLKLHYDPDEALDRLQAEQAIYWEMGEK